MREEIAAIQHDQIWAHWTKYQFSKCVQNEDGSLTIPAELVERWTRQASTLYKELPESERESDRHQADKVLKVIPDVYQQQQLLEKYTQLASRYEQVLESIATMLDNGITQYHGAQYTWERYADQSVPPPEVNTNEVTKWAWAAREEANAALTFEADECGVEREE